MGVGLTSHFLNGSETIYNIILPQLDSKWLITMVIVGTSPKDRVVGPLPSDHEHGVFLNGCDPNHLQYSTSPGMILQVVKSYTLC